MSTTEFKKFLLKARINNYKDGQKIYKWCEKHNDFTEVSIDDLFEKDTLFSVEDFPNKKNVENFISNVENKFLKIEQKYKDSVFSSALVLERLHYHLFWRNKTTIKNFNRLKNIFPEKKENIYGQVYQEMVWDYSHKLMTEKISVNEMMKIIHKKIVVVHFNDHMPFSELSRLIISFAGQEINKDLPVIWQLNSKTWIILLTQPADIIHSGQERVWTIDLHHTNISKEVEDKIRYAFYKDKYTLVPEKGIENKQLVLCKADKKEEREENEYYEIEWLETTQQDWASFENLFLKNTKLEKIKFEWTDEFFDDWKALYTIEGSNSLKK